MCIRDRPQADSGSQAKGAPYAISSFSRAYWYEQFRRVAFDFDSQSVRPYFPYAQVEAGVLETAARLFKIEFRRSTALGWHPDVSVFDVLDAGQPVGRFLSLIHI